MRLAIAALAVVIGEPVCATSQILAAQNALYTDDQAVAAVKPALNSLAQQIPAPAMGIPPAATPSGLVGSSSTYMPGGSAGPVLTRRARVTTASDGTFGITWAVPLVSAMPVAPNPAPINVGSQPIICNYTSVTAAGLAGKCWTAQTTTLSLAVVTAGLALSPATISAAGISLSVFSSEPTQ